MSVLISYLFYLSGDGPCQMSQNRRSWGEHQHGNVHSKRCGNIVEAAITIMNRIEPPSSTRQRSIHRSIRHILNIQATSLLLSAEPSRSRSVSGRIMCSPLLAVKAKGWSPWWLGGFIPLCIILWHVINDIIPWLLNLLHTRWIWIHLCIILQSVTRDWWYHSMDTIPVAD